MSLSVILPEKTKYRSETVDSREIDSPRSSLRFVRDHCGRSIDKTPRNDLARLLARNDADWDVPSPPRFR